MKTIIRSAIATAIGTAAILSIGCAGMMPGGIGPSGLPSMGTGGANDPATVGAACTTKDPARTPEKGTAAHGGYNNQNLPADWPGTYKTEAEVTAAFDKAKAETTNWACMNKFYPGAITVFNGLKGIK